jgi:subtilisin family serine protease
MATLDTELESLLIRKEYFDKNPSAGRLEVGPDELLYISLRFHGDAAALAAAGLQLGSTIGSVAYGQTTLAGLAALASHPQVEAIEKQHKKKLHLDGSVPDIKADQVWARSGDHFSGYTGRGVIVGIVDTGIDIRHQTFRKADGSTRILKIWDQTLTAEFGEGVPGAITQPTIATSPTPLGYGVEYTEGQINDTLNEEDSVPAVVPVRHVDADGHGSHVAGIAAGDGSQNGGCHGAYTYVGVATEADIVMVRMWGLSTGDGNTPPTTPNSVMIDAIRYIFNEARLQNKAAVVNLSMGAFTEQMNGTSSDCLSVDTLLTGNSQGRAVVFSAGNDGDLGFHAAATVPAGPAATLRLDFRLRANDTKARYLAVLYTGSNLQAQITSPVAGAAGQIAWVSSGAAAGTSGTANGAGASSMVTLSNTANRIGISITPPTGGNNMPGTWSIELRDSGATATPVNALCLYGSSHDAKSPNFLNQVTTRSTLDADGTGHECIAVGSCREGGGLSSFSGRGPTLEAVPRTKPELAAPGEQIASAGLARDRTGCKSCCCDCCQDFYVDKSGTSMSAPHVTGVIALMLHKNPNLTHVEVKALLTAHTTAKPGDSTPDDDVGWGAGRLNAKAVVDAVAQVNAPVARAALEVQPLAELHAKVLATPRGPQLQALFERYGAEVWNLIQRNRRVATVWHRCRGPVWVRLALRAAHAPQARLPMQVDGLPLRDGLHRFAKALVRYGSPALQQDVRRLEPDLACIEDGMNLVQIIEALGRTGLPQLAGLPQSAQVPA